MMQAWDEDVLGRLLRVLALPESLVVLLLLNRGFKVHLSLSLLSQQPILLGGILKIIAISWLT